MTSGMLGKSIEGNFGVAVAYANRSEKSQPKSKLHVYHQVPALLGGSTMGLTVLRRIKAYASCAKNSPCSYFSEFATNSSLKMWVGVEKTFVLLSNGFTEIFPPRNRNRNRRKNVSKPGQLLAGTNSQPQRRTGRQIGHLKSG